MDTVRLLVGTFLTALLIVLVAVQILPLKDKPNDTITSVRAAYIPNPTPIDTPGPLLKRYLLLGEAVEKGINLDCSDFNDWSEAQYFLDSSIEEHGYDFANLDGDKDGFACEAL